MKLKVYLSDNDKWDNHQQRVTSDEPGVDFRVYDLNECPEDATIDRDLFNAHNYISALRLGMKLAMDGYDELCVEKIPWEE